MAGSIENAAYEASDEPEATLVRISALQLTDSPRLAGEDVEHVQVLAGLAARLPPILVHRASMRVIDGRHRLRAAVLRGRDMVEARLVDCAEDQLFLLAVQANISHGLPLSVADRQAAAARVLASHPHWSDRAVAAACGLSASNVGTIRRQTSSVQPTARVGRDGRVRPLDGAEGRRRASEVINAYPDASLREIARLAGISPVTARDVRTRLSRGEDPVLAERRNRNRATTNQPPHLDKHVRTRPTGRPREYRDPDWILQTLRNDPSLKFTDSGRMLLRWLDASLVRSEDWARLVADVAPHTAITLAELALACAAAWEELVQHLEHHQKLSAEQTPSPFRSPPPAVAK